jgi:predicted transcriptional regulator
MRILADMMRAIYAANLSHDRLTQYIDELLEKGLIQFTEEDGNNRTYILTDRGREFLKEYVKMERFSQAFGIEL